MPALEAFCSSLGFNLRSEGRKTQADEVKRQMLEASSFGGPSLSFAMPPNEHPKSFVASHFGPGSSNPHKVQFYKGTTTLGFVYKPKTSADKGGIVIAVDSRASSGEYISSKSVMKVLEISDHMVATMAGGAADCQFWIRILAKQCALYALQNGQDMSVAAASKWLSNVLYNYRGMGLSMGSMVAGYDKNGPSLYYVDNDGTRVKGDVFSVGSGCFNAISVLDNARQESMTDKEALDLGRKAIMHATFRDIGSGGTCNLFHITTDGKEYMGKMDVSQMYYDFMKEMSREPYTPREDTL